MSKVVNAALITEKMIRDIEDTIEEGVNTIVSSPVYRQFSDATLEIAKSHLLPVATKYIEGKVERFLEGFMGDLVWFLRPHMENHIDEYEKEGMEVTEHKNELEEMEQQMMAWDR